MADMIKIRSATDATVSLYNSMLPIRKVWNKRGAIVPIEERRLFSCTTIHLWKRHFAREPL